MTTRTRILLLDTGNEWGGGTNSLFELLKRIDRERFDITCLFYRDYSKGQSTLSRELTAIGMPLRLLPQRKQPLWAKLAKELARGLLAWHKPWRQALVKRIEHAWRIAPNAAAIARQLRDERFDLLYMNNQPRSNLEGYLAAERTGVPVVQHCRIEPLMDAADAAIVNRVASKVIGVSNGVVGALVRHGVQPDKCVAVLNGIDPAQPLPDGTAVREQLLAGREHEIVLGAVGQLVERKGLRFLLQATAELLRRQLPVRLLLVGDGPQRAELERLAASLGIAGQVVFAGFQPQPLAYTAAMDVCVLVSQSEGLPRVLLEAMLLAKPVVASRVVGSQELVADDDSGLLVPYGDSAALAEALAKLVADAGLRQRMGQAGEARVKAQYTIARYVAGTEAILAEAARKP